MKINIKKTAYIVGNTNITEEIANNLLKVVDGCELVYLDTKSYRDRLNKYTYDTNICIYVGKDYSFTRDNSGFVRNGTQAEELENITSKDSYNTHYASTVQMVDETGNIRQIFNHLLGYCHKENLWYIDTTTDIPKMYQPGIDSKASKNAIELTDSEKLWQRATGMDALTVKWMMDNNYPFEDEIEPNWCICPVCNTPVYKGRIITPLYLRKYYEPPKCACGWCEW